MDNKTQQKKNNNIIQNFSLIIIASFVIFYILYIWASIIIPFIVALLFSFAIIWLSNFFKNYKIPSFISFILAILSYSIIFWLIWKMLWSNIQDLIRLLPEYQEKILTMINQLFDYLKVPESTNITEIFKSLDLQYIFTLFVNWFTSIFSNTWIIFIYVIFILLEYRYFRNKLNLIIENSPNKKNILDIIIKVRSDIKSYFVIKTYVSILTALFSYIIMILFWLDFAIFWALLIFILNFIPSIWSIIAVLLASGFSLIQFDSYYSFIFITSLLTTVQITMWNIVEPKFMWNRLNLSPLVIIITLLFWWSIWWIVWMLLSVPIMVIINIVLSKIPTTRNIAILLSEKWELTIDSDDNIIKSRKKIIWDLKRKIVKK